MNGRSEHSFNRILLIDDEPGIRKILSLDLSAEGYEVLTAENGETGLAVFEAERPDIVLTDIKMPGLDGLEVLRRIKSDGGPVEVIVITGHGDMDSAVKSLQLEASDFITKPISEEALAVALKRAQERLAMKAQLAAYTADLESRVAEASERLIQAERMAAIGQTVTSLAHTVKNILGGLKGGLYVAAEGRKQGDEEMLDQGLTMLERNVRRVADFVADLLTVAKPRRPEIEPADAADLTREALSLMAAEAEAKGVELIDAGLEAGIEIELDQKAVLQALLNLVSNAIDAASEMSAGRVRVSIEPTEAEIAFVVEDNGPGLTEEAEANLFKGFFSTKGAAGTGLGLMVAQKIAGEHGGRVEYLGLPERGCRFSLVLPRVSPVKDETNGSAKNNDADPGELGAVQDRR